jgi:hypothetical protein
MLGSVNVPKKLMMGNLLWLIFLIKKIVGAPSSNFSDDDSVKLV